MQNRRAFLFLILAVALGVGAAFTARQWLEEQRRLPAKERLSTQPVTVVRQDASVGSVLHRRQLVMVDWPIDSVPQGSYADPSQLDGRVLRRPLASGEPVLETALLPEGASGGLMSVIDPSHRAVSVKVDPVVGVAGFVIPGSHVDVLTTIQRVDSDGFPYTKVMLQDVQVLAIDQKLQEAREGDPALVQVVTLEVSPEQAEKLTYAAHQGRLQLALRNPTDREIVETHSVGVADVLGDRRPPVQPPTPHHHAPAPPRTNVEVIKGSQVSVESF